MTASSPHRPTIAVTQHAISAGHYLAATAGFDILQAGGNAIDAGCAAGIALGVLQSDLVVGRLHQIIDQTLLGEPHGELVRRRDRVDPGLEIERVDVVADEVQLAM